jgi:TonB family protein
MHSNRFEVVLSALLLLLLSSPLRARAIDAREHLKDLARANSLDAEGAQPWHLRISFQLNDLNGKPKETGTIEEWWASPQSHRIEIKSPSYNVTIPSGPSDPPQPATHTRESYLVNELLNQVVHPIPDYAGSHDLNVTEEPRTFGKLTLSCITVSPVIGKAGFSSSPPEFCFAPGSSVLRGHLDTGHFAAVRNTIGTFRGIDLGLDNALAYGPTTAITGHVDKLESFHPDASIVMSVSPAGTPSFVPGVVLAGRILKKVQPTYPAMARDRHIGGTVLLCATISKQGTIQDVDVLSSSSPLLTDSAIEAVKHWTYQPYLLNGSPTEVDTTITVNYNLNPY